MQTIPNIRTLKNILVMRCEGSLGDAVISSGVFREMKRANPSLKITVACFNLGYEFLKKNSYIDEIFQLPVRTHIRRHQRWPSLIWAGWQLRRRHFDLVIDSSGECAANWRLCKWLAAGTRLLDVFHEPQLSHLPNYHASHYESILLRLLGIETPNVRYDIPVPLENQQYISGKLSRQKINHYILLNPSGSIDQRCFRPRTIECLCGLLVVLNLPVILPTPPNKEIYWETACKHLPQLHVLPTPNLFDLIALVKRASLVITPDTSVVHIASGFQKKTLAFYNNFTAHYAPNNPHAFVIHTAPSDVNEAKWEQVTQIVQQIKQGLLT